MLMLSLLAASGKGRAIIDRYFRVRLPNGLIVVFCEGVCANSVDLDTKSGGGKWMYDQAARSFGFSPIAARSNPKQNGAVMLRLNETINAWIGAAKKQKPRKIVSWQSHFRSILVSVTRNSESAATANLNAQQAALAKLPGASTLSNPAVRGGVHLAISLEQRLLGITAPHLAAAAKMGLSTGAALAYVAASDRNPLGKPHEATHADQNKNPQPGPRLNPAAAALDTDKDGKLQCLEIGKWKPDTGYHPTNNSRAYQDYVSGFPGTDFQTHPIYGKQVKFDGCRTGSDGRALLLEAKANYGNLLGGKWSKAELKTIPEQGIRQHRAATLLGVRNEWHAQSENDTKVIQQIFKDKAEIPTPVIHTPMSVEPKK